MDYCVACSNTGRYKQPNDKEEFDRLFEKYDRPGTMNMHECYNKAINEVGYTAVSPCPFCNRKAE